MKKRRIITIWIVLLLLLMVTFSLFSCFGKKPPERTIGQLQLLFTPPVPIKVNIEKGTMWVEERTYSGNKGYIMRDGASVYFGCSTVVRIEITEQ